MGNIISFRDLIFWQKSHEFVLETYRISSAFPKEETYALTSQLRRAAVSIPANIAEGFTKKTLQNKLNYISHSEGSLQEVKYYLILERDLIYINNITFENAINSCEEIGKLLNGYIKTIRNYHQNK
ncbi:four helix bundle protein [Chryseobacterium sp. CFS15]|uniref:four helix bundle protein n=1 Tax=Chryseobacterium sp. CFS15 TaxID=2986946 RepID=UPI00280934AB|nr:four helix bundle protein [Chryseobacterium sp. CFS15]MDQ8144018.1 four helix bundle protein [Chryseobacterium sp. CFS15]